MSKRKGLPETIESRHKHYVDDLLGRSGEEVSLGRIIPITSIRANERQPRTNIGDLSGLKESIQEKGILEPLIVKQDGAEFIIISGERRYRAALELGLKEIPCIIRESDEQDTLEVALIENLQRLDLSPFEEADGLKELSGNFNLSHNEIAKKIGKSRSSVSETLALTYIPDDIRSLCQNHGLNSKSMLLQIARQETHADMLRLANEIIQKGMGREEARKKRSVENKKEAKPFTFRFRPESKSYSISVKFKKSDVERAELIGALEEAIRKLKDGE